VATEVCVSQIHLRPIATVLDGGYPLGRVCGVPDEHYNAAAFPIDGHSLVFHAANGQGLARADGWRRQPDEPRGMGAMVRERTVMAIRDRLRLVRRARRRSSSA
jgi:hypothetical protein